MTAHTYQNLIRSIFECANTSLSVKEAIILFTPFKLLDHRYFRKGDLVTPKTRASDYVGSCFSAAPNGVC